MEKLYGVKKIKVDLFMILIITILVQSGCKKLIEVDLPIDKNTSETVYGNTGTAVSVLNGIYIRMSRGSFATGSEGISLNAGLMADELVVNNELNKGILYTNSYATDPTSCWQQMYSEYVFRVNSVIEGVSLSKGIPDGHKKILLGEAKLLRALIYFNLVNLYGDVPLVTTTDFTINSNIPRTSKKLVYDQIIMDLAEAQEGLTEQYLGLDISSATQERVRPNKAVATSLLSKVYIYLGEWQKAEEQATKIIANTATYELTALNDVFLKNSKEAIWQLQTVPNPDLGLDITGDAHYFIPLMGDIPNVCISPYLQNSFESNDQRKQVWIRNINSGADEYLIPNKYKSGRDGIFTDPEYNMVFRLAEQYLIRAEARAKLGKLTGANSAESDLNAIRSRAGLTASTAIGQTAVLDAILHERQVELFTEWGHRWFDLKRTVKIDAVMSIATQTKGGTWAPYKALLPIPFGEFSLNPALRGHQNPGYIEPSN